MVESVDGVYDMLRPGPRVEKHARDAMSASSMAEGRSMRKLMN